MVILSGRLVRSDGQVGWSCLVVSTAWALIHLSVLPAGGVEGRGDLLHAGHHLPILAVLCVGRPVPPGGQVPHPVQARVAQVRVQPRVQPRISWVQPRVDPWVQPRVDPRVSRVQPRVDPWLPGNAVGGYGHRPAVLASIGRPGVVVGISVVGLTMVLLTEERVSMVRIAVMRFSVMRISVMRVSVMRVLVWSEAHRRCVGARPTRQSVTTWPVLTHHSKLITHQQCSESWIHSSLTCDKIAIPKLFFIMNVI